MLGMKPFGALGAGGRGGGGLGRRAALFLDFVNGMYTVNRQRRALADIMTIAGGVNGTRVNSAGLIEAATCPRFDYDPVTLAARGVLVEEQRTNLLTYSNDFSNAAWTTATANIQVNGERLESNNAGGPAAHQCYQIGNTISAGSFSGSAHFKASEVQWAILNLFDGSDKRAYFDALTGVVGTVEPSFVGQISPAGSDYFRATIAGALGNSANGGMSLEITTADGSATSTIPIADGLSARYAQFEAGAFATSYIPTTSAAVTRTSDSLTMAGTDFSDWWNQAEGTIVVKFDCFATDADDSFMFSASDVGGAEQIRLLVYASSVYFQVATGGVTVVNMNLGPIDTGRHTLAVAYKANDFAACLDGGTVSTDTSGAVPAVDRAGFGRYAAINVGHLNGHLQAFAYEPRRLSNSMLQALS